MKALKILLSLMILFSLFSAPTHADELDDLFGDLFSESWVEDGGIQEDGSIQNGDVVVEEWNIASGDAAVTEDQITDGENTVNEGMSVPMQPMSDEADVAVTTEEEDMDMNAAWEIEVTQLPTTWAEEMLLLLLSLMIAGGVMYIKNSKKA